MSRTCAVEAGGGRPAGRNLRVFKEGTTFSLPPCKQKVLPRTVASVPHSHETSSACIHCAQYTVCTPQFALPAGCSAFGTLWPTLSVAARQCAALLPPPRLQFVFVRCSSCCPVCLLLLVAALCITAHADPSKGAPPDRQAEGWIVLPF